MDGTVKDQFWAFVHERHAIWRRREVDRLPPPWTEDKVLANHHFTNVYRELDKGTVWFHANRSGEFRRQAWQSITYRLVNRQQTFEDWKAFSGEPFPQRDQIDAWIGWLRHRMDAKVKTFTGRHQVIGLARMEQALKSLADVPESFWTDLRATHHPKDAIKLIGGLYGLGPRFFGNQVYMDLAEAGWFPGHPQWTWMGPGAKAAMQLIYGDIFGADGTYQDRLSQLVHEAGTELAAASAEPFGPPPLPGVNDLYPLRPKDVEHALCEFQKYHRVVRGEGAYKIEPGVWHDSRR